MTRGKPRWFLATLAALMVPMALAVPAGAAEASLSATVDGQAAAGSKESRPVRLPTAPAVVDLRVTNQDSSPLVARTVRFSGSVMGLTMFAYETSIDLRVAPGATESRRFTLDLSALDGQATGLLPASISLLDADRKRLASQSLTVDVRGSVWSVYGFFGLMLAVLTGIALAASLLALAGHRLSPNRWSRGVRFLVPGIGLGMVLVIGLSVLRVFAPRVSRWGPILVICALGLFLVGYLTPTPGDGGPLEADDAGTAAGAPKSAGPARATLPPRRPG